MAGDRLAMDYTGTGQAMSSLGAAGQALQEAWQSAWSQVAGLDGQLGKGPLGEAFMAGYRPASDAVDRAVRQCVSAATGLADAGDQCVAEYRRVQSQATDSIASMVR